jgi:hypothetical protein
VASAAFAGNPEFNRPIDMTKAQHGTRSRIGFTTDRPAMKARGSKTHKASFLGEILVGQNSSVVQHGEGEFA